MKSCLCKQSKCNLHTCILVELSDPLSQNLALIMEFFLFLNATMHKLEHNIYFGLTLTASTFAS